ncbi:hypothetical protein, partial [Klebsiella quasipneumoniae]
RDGVFFHDGNIAREPVNKSIFEEVHFVSSIRHCNGIRLVISTQQKEHYSVLPFHPGFWYRNGCEMFFACQRSFGCTLVSSEASHLFATLVGRTSCLKHLACTFFRNS